MPYGFYIPRFSPESFEWINWLRQVFWLTPLFPPSRSVSGTVAAERTTVLEFTATGIAPDFHRFPFSSRPVRKPNRCKDGFFLTKIIKNIMHRCAHAGVSFTAEARRRSFSAQRMGERQDLRGGILQSGFRHKKRIARKLLCFLCFCGFCGNHKKLWQAIPFSRRVQAVSGAG